ncbi:MAG TPA: hypothetical protein VE466_16480, partial [Acidimicrobiales bacterium]|nr:hypothetical protein [Acidimicrobiales bacterium]
ISVLVTDIVSLAHSAWTCAPATRSRARGKPAVPSRRTSDTDEAPDRAGVLQMLVDAVSYQSS